MNLPFRWKKEWLPVLGMLLLLMRGTPPHLLDSFSRYFLALSPVFLLLGRIGHRWGLISLWIVSFALQIILTWGFLQWKWVA
ncbi:MAG: hypothetical protein A2Z03_10640 [Chloroflexi bacterium RBG_16_56_8]|nr:MAG: hypothetical protein A2Z03_10640 [Chloroflexi bacterium RBG_16_56_8]